MAPDRTQLCCAQVESNNGITSTDRENSPCSPSPPTTLNSRLMLNDDHLHHQHQQQNIVKSEPMELMCNTNQPDENSNESGDIVSATNTDNGPNSLPQGPHSGSSGGGDHEDHDSPIGPYLTASESKLFATAAGSFNFSMAALAADPTGLGG